MRFLLCGRLLEIGGGILLHDFDAAGAASVKRLPVDLALQRRIDRVAGYQAGIEGVAFAQKLLLFLLLAFDRLQIKVGILFHYFGAARAADIKDAPIDFILEILVHRSAHYGTGIVAVTLAEEFLLGVFCIRLLVVFVF